MSELKNGSYEDKNGDVSWFKDGLLHREDGPAIEGSDGHKEWWIEGKVHREDGPAVESSDGHKEWWIEGKVHREDGPAVERANGDRLWYLNYIQCTEEEFNQWLAKKELNEKLQITLGEKPVIKKPKI